jgi:uronate dehydrogenase
MKRLLITGAKGIVGTGLRESLAETYRLRLSVRSAKGLDLGPHEVVEGDISDAEAIDRAVQGSDAILHLAASYALSIPLEETLDVNYLGLAQLMDAAVRHKVRHVVFASSNHGWGFYPRTRAPLADTAPPRPDGWYGVSKIFGEAVMAYYGDAHDMATTSLRIGNCGPDVPDERCRHMWISFRDLSALVKLAIEREDVGHRAVFATADCAAPFFDNASAKAMGFVTRDHPDEHLRHPGVAEEPPVPGIAGLSMGGGFPAANFRGDLEEWRTRT